MSQQTILTIIFASGILLFMVGVIAWQQSRLRRLSQPKTGFLGKTLPGLIATLVIGAGLVGGVYMVQQRDTSIDTSAKFNIEISYSEPEFIARTDKTATYEFTVLPGISAADKQSIANPGSIKYDVFWNFSGPQTEAVSDISVADGQTSKARVTLQKGTYTVTVLVRFVDDNDQPHTQTLTKESVQVF